jgi:nucleoside-triphosphatase
MKNIYILTGPVQTGKTTRLTEWAKDKTNIDGILQPAINDERYLVDIRSNVSKRLTAGKEQSDTVSVGQYIFDKKVFMWANAELINYLENRPGWIIVDEVGKLELAGEGLDSAVFELLQKSSSFPFTKFLFVVRDSLLNSFLEYYNLKIEDIEKFEFPED